MIDTLPAATMPFRCECGTSFKNPRGFFEHRDEAHRPEPDEPKPVTPDDEAREIVLALVADGYGIAPAASEAGTEYSKAVYWVREAGGAKALRGGWYR